MGCEGYAPEEVIGKNPRLLNSGHNSPEEYRELWRTITSGGEWRGELRNKKKNGEFYWEFASISAIRDADGKIINFLAVKEDITRRKRAEAERATLEAQLREAQKLEALGTLAGGIAHDFNNILAGMTGYAHLAMDGVPAKSQVWSDLEQLMKGIDRSAKLVRQILAFSRRGDGERHPLEVHRVVVEVVELLRAMIPATIEIRCKIARDTGTVIADETQLQQVVLNLCTNAADAIGEGPGVIEVGLSVVEVGEGDGAAYPDLEPGAHVKLTVRDSGVGMDDATRARVFEPFFTTKEPGKGTGLGLSVAYGIVREHGGTIRVEPVPAEGTVVTILLPRAETAAPPPGADAEDRAIPEGSERILLVDDEAAIARSRKRLLERLGYKVRAETSSVGALKTFRGAPEAFDLVITDEAMPKIRGKTLAREILKIRGEMPIILCSGFTDSRTVETAKAAGIREFMKKPVSTPELARTVRRVLDADGT